MGLSARGMARIEAVRRPANASPGPFLPKAQRLSPSLLNRNGKPMEWKRKAQAVAAIPQQLKSMTVLVIAAVIISILALMTSLVAVRHAN